MWTTTTAALDRDILRLALPTFATLVSEPLLLLADSAIIGHLGTDELAGLGIAANLLGILTGLSVFLAYNTTSTVARRIGAGDTRAALAGGVDGLVLALLLGVVLAAGLTIATPTLVTAYASSPGVATAARTYLHIAAWGLPSILLLLAGTGVLRGLQDTRTPLVVVIATNLVNIALNFTLVYGAGLGIAGSALGTLIAQTGGALGLILVVIGRTRAHGVRLRIHPGGVLLAARSGGWLVLRTGALQTGITLTTVVAAGLGTVALAAHQVLGTIWILLAFGLDAIAIAGQSIIGRALGAGDIALGRSMTRRMIGWGIVVGVVFGAIVALARPAYDGLFSPDPGVQHLLGQTALVLAVATPFAGVVFVLDGVLIGAGDGRYLALAGGLALAAYVPLAVLVHLTGAGLVWLWVAYAGYLLARMITLMLRVRTTAWTRAGT